MLRARRASHDIFRFGRYDPLTLDGSAAGHLFAFARIHADRHTIVAVPRIVVPLTPEGRAPLGDVWRDTRIAVPEEAPGCYRQAFTGECARVVEQDGRRWVRAADAFARFPLAWLEMM
jgi:(1->4)-alpha-D-glucan 1-alpha-D-glucosylmutase